MQIVRKSVQFTAATISGVFIILTLAGFIGVWLAERKAAEIAQNGFGLVGTAVRVIDAGVARVDGLISASRTEVQQVAETMTTVDTRTEANRPVLKALSERLETSLAPRIIQIQQALSPVRDAVGIIVNTVGLLNSIPTMAERVPRLGDLDESFKRLEELSLDTTQLRSTLRSLIDAHTKEVSEETIATIKGLTQRIDTRLGETQANVQGVQAEIDALQVRLDFRKSRLLFSFSLLALIVTAMLIWTLYSQIVVIRHHRIRASLVDQRS